MFLSRQPKCFLSKLIKRFIHVESAKESQITLGWLCKLVYTWSLCLLLKWNLSSPVLLILSLSLVYCLNCMCRGIVVLSEILWRHMNVFCLLYIPHTLSWTLGSRGLCCLSFLRLVLGCLLWIIWLWRWGGLEKNCCHGENDLITLKCQRKPCFSNCLNDRITQLEKSFLTTLGKVLLLIFYWIH